MWDQYEINYYHNTQQNEQIKYLPLYTVISKAVREIITNAYILDQINGYHAQNNENLCDNAENNQI